ncbi:hypothetical protein HGRIS_010261 [Hohenbuehelia grisea]|uniref:AB hydrolase-1 domain-containing protein n=1 Tax=Hohenbuehelia grisea TaxID=104357 RepID=A0ABR3J3R1_9AGAR
MFQPQNQALTVDDSGTQLTFFDTGPPSRNNYTTLVAVHGIIFNNKIFRKLAAHSFTRGIRVIAINRRGYSESTPFSVEQKAERASVPPQSTWLHDRGIEIAKFIDGLIQKEHLPEVSVDAETGSVTGGVVILGWSAGASYTNATIACVEHLEAAIQSRLGTHLRGNIVYDAPSIALGKPLPAKTYWHELDTFIPPVARIPSFMQWMTSYFKHNNLASRDPELLEYVLPGLDRAPSIWNMSTGDIAAMSEEEIYAVQESPGLISGSLLEPAARAYETSVFGKQVRQLLPHLQTLVVCGDSTVPYIISAFWAIQEDDKANGGGNVRYQLVPGANHFMHWDEPEKTLDALLEIL